VGAKLRQIGPIAVANVAYCIVKPWPAPWGEAFAVAGLRDATVVVGRGVYIQVGMRG
jgi:hypothetical protein